MNVDVLSRRAPATGQVEPARATSPRRLWLWLVLGAALLSVSVMQTVVPIAAWLAWVFLMRFVRLQRPLVAFPALVVAVYPAYLVAMRGFLPLAELLPFALVGLADLLPLAADRLAGRRLHGIPRTLIFPTAVTALSFLASGGEFGTLGSPAYTQVGDLAMSQIAGVTGLWGVSFLIAWLAPVANEVWERGFDLRAAARPVAAFTLTVVVVVAYGGVQLAFFPPAGDSVRMAAISPSRALSDAYAHAGIAPGPRTDAERRALRERYLDPIVDDLFDRTQQAAAAGAKVVAWSEAAAFVFAEDEADLIGRGRRIADAEDIYLLLGTVSILPRTELPTIDIRAILVDDHGAVVWDYQKAKVPLNDGNAPGPGVLPVADTPYGRLSAAICFDADFPGLIRQAGAADADVLFLPSSDWEPIAEMHARMTVPRAIENGVAVLRPTRQGVSLALDSQGRTLGRADYFAQDAVTLLVDVPTQARTTVYSRVGDAFGWLTVAALVALATAAGARASKARRRTRRPTGSDASGR